MHEYLRFLKFSSPPHRIDTARHWYRLDANVARCDNFAKPVVVYSPQEVLLELVDLAHRLGFAGGGVQHDCLLARTARVEDERAAARRVELELLEVEPAVSELRRVELAHAQCAAHQPDHVVEDLLVAAPRLRLVGFHGAMHLNGRARRMDENQARTVHRNFHS